MSESGGGVNADEPLVELKLDRLGPQNPGLNPDMLVEPTRAILDQYHQNPARFFLVRPTGKASSRVLFGPPDPRSKSTVEHERLVELGAIALGALLLNLDGLIVSRVVKRRGQRFDYFVTDLGRSQTAILEVGGTAEQSFEGLLTQKVRQVRGSPHRWPPLSMVAYAAATRFAPAAKSGVRYVGAEDEVERGPEG